MASPMLQICSHFRSFTRKTITANYSTNAYSAYRVFDGRKFPENKGGRDPVTDTPDWCYADGRPGHYTMEQKKKIVKQMEYAKKIESMLHEIDLTVDNHERRLKAKNERIQHKFERQPIEKVAKRHIQKLNRQAEF